MELKLLPDSKDLSKSTSIPFHIPKTMVIYELDNFNDHLY